MLTQITKIEDILDMREEYYVYLLSPMDDMYEEGIIPACTFYKIFDKEVLGYVAIDDQQSILQFHLTDRDRKDAYSLFENILK